VFHSIYLVVSVCECRYLVNLSLDISSTSLPSLVCVELSIGARQCSSWSEALPHSSEAVPHLEFNFYSSLFLNRPIHPSRRHHPFNCDELVSRLFKEYRPAMQCTMSLDLGCWMRSRRHNPQHHSWVRRVLTCESQS
jgi:hypothetical protein